MYFFVQNFEKQHQMNRRILEQRCMMRFVRNDPLALDRPQASTTACRLFPAAAAASSSVPSPSVLTAHKQYGVLANDESDLLRLDQKH